jgi:hypothetical protein
MEGEDISEDYWYPPFDTIGIAELFSQFPINQGLTFDDYLDQPDIYLDTYVDELSEVHESTVIYPNLLFSAIEIILASTFSEDLPYSPFSSELMTEDNSDESAWYDALPDPVEIWFFNQVLDVNIIFQDYTESLDTLTDDTSEELAWYDALPDPVEFWLFNQIIIAHLIFIDYNPVENEIVTEDLSDEQSWYPVIYDPDWWASVVITAPEWFLTFQDYADYLDLYLEDTSEELAWYDALSDPVEMWLFNQIIVAHLIFIDYVDYLELYTDDSGEESTWYDALPDPVEFWLFNQPAQSLFIFLDYTPLETELSTEDLGDDSAWYNAVPDPMELIIITQILPAVLVFQDLAPLELDQLIEDLGDEVGFYPPFGMDFEFWFPLPLGKLIKPEFKFSAQKYTALDTTTPVINAVLKAVKALN